MVGSVIRVIQAGYDQIAQLLPDTPEVVGSVGPIRAHAQVQVEPRRYTSLESRFLQIPLYLLDLVEESLRHVGPLRVLAVKRVCLTGELLDQLRQSLLRRLQCLSGRLPDGMASGSSDTFAHIDKLLCDTGSYVAIIMARVGEGPEQGPHAGYLLHGKNRGILLV